MENLERYKKVFMEVFEANEETLGENFTTENVERWDSVGQMALITALEQEFDIMFDIDDIYEFTSYPKGIEILKKYEVEF